MSVFLHHTNNYIARMAKLFHVESPFCQTPSWLPCRSWPVNPKVHKKCKGPGRARMVLKKNELVDPTTCVQTPPQSSGREAGVVLSQGQTHDQSRSKPSCGGSAGQERG